MNNKASSLPTISAVARIAVAMAQLMVNSPEEVNVTKKEKDIPEKLAQGRNRGNALET